MDLCSHRATLRASAVPVPTFLAQTRATPFAETNYSSLLHARVQYRKQGTRHEHAPASGADQGTGQETQTTPCAETSHTPHELTIGANQHEHSEDSHGGLILTSHGFSALKDALGIPYSCQLKRRTTYNDQKGSVRRFETSNGGTHQRNQGLFLRSSWQRKSVQKLGLLCTSRACTTRKSWGGPVNHQASCSYGHNDTPQLPRTSTTVLDQCCLLHLHNSARSPKEDNHSPRFISDGSCTPTHFYCGKQVTGTPDAAYGDRNRFHKNRSELFRPVSTHFAPVLKLLRVPGCKRKMSPGIEN